MHAFNLLASTLNWWEMDTFYSTLCHSSILTITRLVKNDSYLDFGGSSSEPQYGILYASQYTSRGMVDGYHKD